MLFMPCFSKNFLSSANRFAIASSFPSAAVYVRNSTTRCEPSALTVGSWPANHPKPNAATMRPAVTPYLRNIETSFMTHGRRNNLRVDERCQHVVTNPNEALVCQLEAATPTRE